MQDLVQVRPTSSDWLIMCHNDRWDGRDGSHVTGCHMGQGETDVMWHDITWDRDRRSPHETWHGQVVVFVSGHAYRSVEGRKALTHNIFTFTSTYFATSALLHSYTGSYALTTVRSKLSLPAVRNSVLVRLRTLYALRERLNTFSFPFYTTKCKKGKKMCFDIFESYSYVLS